LHQTHTLKKTVYLKLFLDPKETIFNLDYTSKRLGFKASRAVKGKRVFDGVLDLY
jgi:hypothetical protein